MNLLPLLALSPATGDDSPQKNTIVLVILGVAFLAAIVLGVFSGKKK
ncbi:MAG: hypothetical protein J6R77_02875 [Clostridia bacterium]|nr:hypothetical protein [Clostridia bacterium]